MIRNTFQILPRVRTKTEQKWWKLGIKTWSDFIKTEKIKCVRPAVKQYYNSILIKASNALLEGDSTFFTSILPSKEKWLLYDHFREECGYLDIEIDSRGKITLVGISNYYTTNTFVKGVNLDQNTFKKELAKYKLVITFNGSAFDLPKLKKELGVTINVPHIDLKPLCVNLNLRGGLKEVEKQLNLKRPAHLNGNPVDLWKAFHASGDKEYLDLLIKYNAEDIENLKGVMEHCYKKLTTLNSVGSAKTI
ncbi:TPA: hypothetical protein HA241_01435 [Candidatus Woesearchaeota archaeon]|nr:hypothetical protein [Candidatus Woesearchaeota archaeon]